MAAERKRYRLHVSEDYLEVEAPTLLETEYLYRLASGDDEPVKVKATSPPRERGCFERKCQFPACMHAEEKPKKCAGREPVPKS